MQQGALNTNESVFAVLAPASQYEPRKKIKHILKESLLAAHEKRTPTTLCHV
jgi:ABC-type uncharacterized transport system ATPase subunit